jgi:protease-4
MTLATTIFGFSLALNAYLLIWTGFASGGDGAHQSVVVSGDLKQKIAVVPLEGLIDDGAVKRFERTIKQIESDENVKAVVLEVDTPGGTVTASDEIYDRILRLKEKKGMPVVVSMGSLATSGGYYLSCAADTIVAQRTTITGNIGVMLPRYNLSKLADKWGVEDNSMHSTGADFKTAGSMLKPETPEEHAYWLGLIDDAFVTFKDVVSRGRASRLKESMEVVANGKAYSASEALRMGLIDQIGYKSAAYDAAAQAAGLTNKHVVRYEPVPSFMQALGMGSATRIASQTSRTLVDAEKMTINGVNLNFDTNWMYELTTPRLMYLWRGP